MEIQDRSCRITTTDTMRIIMPTALHQEEETAFEVALRLALERKGSLTLLHVGPEDRDHTLWERFPKVRRTLERWGQLPKDSRPSDVHHKLGITIRKHALQAGKVTRQVADHVGRHTYDLMVMATEGRSAWQQLLLPSRAEPIADEVSVPTLFIPVGGRSVVREDDGALSIANILIPTGDPADTVSTVPLAMDMARVSVARPVHITLLHVGDDPRVLDTVVVPETDGIVWHRRMLQGDLVGQVVATADAMDADMIIMATRGTDSFADGLFGTHTERTLRACRRPVIAVPEQTVVTGVD